MPRWLDSTVALPVSVLHGDEVIRTVDDGVSKQTTPTALSTFTRSLIVVDDLSNSSANAKSLLVAANYAAMRGLLDLEAGTDFYSISAANAATTAAIAAAVGVSVQAYNANLTTLGAGGSGARDFLNLGTGDSPQFTAINLGHASDTTVTRASAGRASVEGRLLAFRSAINVTDPEYAATGDGTTDDRAAFVAASAAGGTTHLPKPTTGYTVSSPITITGTSLTFDPSSTWDALTDDGTIDWSYGMFRDEGMLPIHRFAGRSFFGEMARHSGNRFGAISGYGDDNMSQNVATWVIKNAQVAAMSPEPSGKIGIFGAAWVQPGVAGSIGAGIAGYARNDGISGTARAAYFDLVANKSTGLTAADVCAEFQVGNYTGTTPTISSYDMSNSIVNGMQIGVVAQNGYTIGNSDTAHPTATDPSGAAIDVSGGDLLTDWQKWIAGIVFRNGALIRDGSNFADALIFAQKHKLKWEVSAFTEGAAIWSEVTAGASRMAMAFRNNEVTFYGPTGQTIAGIRHDTAGGTTVNNLVFKSARTAVAPAIITEGSDTNIILELQTKGTGATRFTSHAGSGENLRLSPPASAPTDYLTIAGTAAGGIAAIGAAGASTNINITITPKGTGIVQSAASFRAHSGTAIPAGGTAGAGVLVSSTSNFGVFFGSGAPTLSAAKGSLYLRSDGSTTNDRAYINTNGTTTWTALTTAA